MSDVVLIENSMLVSGDIDFHTVVSLRDEGVSLIKEIASSVVDSSSMDNSRELGVDLADVGAVNTAAMALLISWHRTAREFGIRLEYRNVPSPLVAISQMSDLESLLSV